MILIHMYVTSDFQANNERTFPLANFMYSDVIAKQSLDYSRCSDSPCSCLFIKMGLVSRII